MNHFIFLIPVENSDWFNSYAEYFGNCGPAILPVLSFNGTEPATHGWCGVSLSSETELQVKKLIEANSNKNIVCRISNIEESPSFPKNLLQEFNLKCISHGI